MMSKNKAGLFLIIIIIIIFILGIILVLSEYKKDITIDYEIVITFKNDINVSRCIEIINKIGGTKYKETNDTNQYMIQQLDKNFTSLDKLERYCEQINNKYDEIKHVNLLLIPDPCQSFY